MEITMQQYKFELKEYLHSKNIHVLRVYGRMVGVERPTTKDKVPLIADIVSVLVGEVEPVAQSMRGAPVKHKDIPYDVIEQVREIHENCFKNLPAEAGGIKALFPDLFVNGEIPQPKFSFSSTVGESTDKKTHRGQYHKIDGVARVLPVDCSEEDEVVLLPDLLIQQYDLHEGDVLSFRASKGKNSLIVKQILTVNDCLELPLKRGIFEKEEGTIPHSPIVFSSEKQTPTPLLKYLDWVVNIQKGQRCCVVSSPKVGKTNLLYTALNALVQKGDIAVMALLIDQPPETVSLYRSAIDSENLIYTTYEDEVEKQAFTAEFILNRAKRRAESGQDVVLFVDGLNALAHAYNQTENAVGGRTMDGGLESKTLRYLKKFFGSAKSLKKGGSLTIIGALSYNTGNPADDLLSRELTAIASAEIHLDEKLALKRIFPPIDGVKTRADFGGMQDDKDIQESFAFLKTQYLPAFGNEGLNALLLQAENRQDFIRLAHSKTVKKA